MKKLLFLLLLCAVSFAGRAQNFYNNTSYDVTIQFVCYDLPGCTYTVCSGPTTVTAGNNIPLVNCGCTSSQRRGFIVCCAATPTVCTSVGPPSGPYNCPQFPASNTLPSCSGYPAATLSWISGPNLRLQ